MNRSVMNLVTGALIAGAVLLSVAPTTYAVERFPSEVGDSALEVCRNESGSLRSGELDVIILLDNSKSLWNSDKAGVRFEAIEGFVDSFQQIKDRAKNLSLIKFGAFAEVVVPFRKVSTLDDTKEIKESLRQRVPNDYESLEKLHQLCSSAQARPGSIRLPRLKQPKLSNPHLVYRWGI